MFCTFDFHLFLFCKSLGPSYTSLLRTAMKFCYVQETFVYLINNSVEIFHQNFNNLVVGGLSTIGLWSCLILDISRYHIIDINSHQNQPVQIYLTHITQPQLYIINIYSRELPGCKHVVAFNCIRKCIQALPLSLFVNDLIHNLNAMKFFQL